MPPRKQPTPSVRVEQALGPTPERFTRPESVVLRFRRHGRRLLLPCLILIAVAAAAGYWVGALPEFWMDALAAVGAVLLGLLFGVLPILRWLATRTTVTTHRVIMRSGLFSRHHSEVSLARVREVRRKQRLWSRMWGAGDIQLLIGSESATLPDVAGVRDVSDALQELVQRNYVAAASPAGPDYRTTRLPLPGTGVAAGAAPDAPTSSFFD